MKKNIFGKGETVLIDRMKEKFLIKGNGSALREPASQATITFSNREYFYILRKMYHTFMFDMKEFAVDFYEISIEEYINTLLWLTYVQSVIYKLDLSIEKYASNISTGLDVDFELVRNELKLFLKNHNLFDLEIDRCINSVIQYLVFEKEQIHQNNRLSKEEIFNILDLKSADLEILRRIIIKVCDIRIQKKEMGFFKLLDKIREIFDDIRDYEEDLNLKNFNTLLYLKRGCDSPDLALDILEEYIEKECARCVSFAEQMGGKKRNKFLAIGTRLKQEKNFYLTELHRLSV